MLSEGAVCAGVGDITVYEHRARDVRLREDEARALRRELAGQLDVLEGLATGEYRLQARQYVGLVVLPTGRVLEIRPKVHVGVLFAMLAKAHHLADFGTEAATYTSVRDLFEFVVGFFVGMVEDLVARGVLQGFEPREDELLALRGKVLVSETVRRRPVVRDRHWCAFTEFTADVLENRVLKLACDGLLPFPYRSMPDLSCRLRRLLRAFAGVTLDTGATEGFERLVYHRLNEHYRPALSLARLLLSYLSPSGARGGERFLAFLVDMNRLFEQYVTVVLEETAAQRRGLSVIGQDTQYTLDVGGQMTVKPDVVVYGEDTRCLALDAKYKCADQNVDVYQVVAYCHALGLPRGVLAYPASEGISDARHRIRPGGEMEVAILSLDLSGDVADLRRQTRTFVEAVWGEVARV
jgi:5-methylcytosine-specific restriction enzyme subunit McrC